MSSSLTSRVVQRSIRADTFIPDKIWKDHKLAVKKVLASPLTYKDPGDAGYDFGTQLLPIFQKTVERLNDIGGLPKALEQSLADRLDNITYVLDKLTKSAETFRRAYESEIASGPVDAEFVVARSITFEIGEFYRETVKTVGDALKATWSLDPKMVRLLAKRLIKKATPDEQRAFVESETNFGGPAARLTYAFYDRVKLPSLAKKLVTREKVSYNFLGWGDFLKEVVDSNYSRKAEPAYRQFDLKGMKVVVDDQSVTDDQIKAYIRYLLEAEHRLRSKGFAKVWYGTVFIRCDSCGGVNYNTGGGVGGNYPIGPDVVNIFSRPSSFIVELMAHELGHRYWFKQMTESQRARFQSLIKVYKKSDIPVVSSREIEAARSTVKEVERSFEDLLDQFQREKDVPKYNRLFHDAVMTDHMYGAISRLTAHNNKQLETAMGNYTGTESSPEVQLRRHCVNMKKYIEGYPEISDGVSAWCHDARIDLRRRGKAALEYIALVEKLSSLEFDSNDTRSVPAVSDYGASNIDEAFAEAFAHYIMGYDMTQDQIESFRAVLKTAGERIAERWSEQSLGEFLANFYRKHTALKKYAPRVLTKTTAGGGSHPEARQMGNDIHLYPKFWQLRTDIQEFVFAHEIGHYVSTQHGLSKVLATLQAHGVDPWDSTSLPFGQFNVEEAFADAFATYHLDRSELAQKYPEWLKSLEDLL